MIDNGSSSFKIGYSGEDIPQAIFPTIGGVSLPNSTGESKKHSQILRDSTRRPESVDSYSEYLGRGGSSGDRNEEHLHPVKRGAITNWDEMEKLWNYAFEEEISLLPETNSISVSIYCYKR